jgi:pimeloyl-ACP methyl ester carboxylesterase
MQAHCPNLYLLANGKGTAYRDLYRAFENYCMGIPNPVKLCGISLGAILAMNYAMNHPEKVTSLILIAPQYKVPRLLFDLQNVIFSFMPPKAFHTGFSKEHTIRLTSSMRNLDFSSTSRVNGTIVRGIILILGSSFIRFTPSVALPPSLSPSFRRISSGCRARRRSWQTKLPPDR